jgi:hypothetical protein
VVQELAENDIALIVGCINILDTCYSVNVGTIFEFNYGDDIVNQYRHTRFSIRAKNPQDQISSVSDYQSLFRASEGSERLRDAISHYSPGMNWYDIYKSLESLKLFYGSEDKLHKNFHAQRADIVKLRRTANSSRHTRSAFEPISDPMELREATAFLGWLLTTAGTQAAAARPMDAFPPGSQVTMVDREFPANITIGLNELRLGPVEEGGDQDD